MSRSNSSTYAHAKIKISKANFMQNIIFAWRQDSGLSRFRSRHRCYSNQMWNISSTNSASFMERPSLIDELLCQFSHLLLDTLHRRVARYHSRHSLIDSRRTRHDHSSSLEIFTHDRSSSLDVLVTIAHRHSRFSFTIAHRRSTHSSRSLTITREFHSRSLDVISDRSASTEVVKNKLIEAREVFKKRVLSRFQTKDLLVRFVSTRYESRHSSILRLRLNIYTLQHVSSHSIASILVHSTHTSICSLFMLMLWHECQAWHTWES